MKEDASSEQAGHGHAWHDQAPAGLTVIGLGIKLDAHVTREAVEALRNADIVLHATPTPGMTAWLQSFNGRLVDLTRHYGEGRDRMRTYEAMVDDILSALHDANRVCAAFYGHPAVYVTPSHMAISRARAQGHAARMLPGISAEDCLFADLGVDPGADGWQSYDATPFVLYRPNIDTHSSLVLWQLEVLGRVDYRSRRIHSHLDLLSQSLLRHYPGDHRVTIYEASLYPGFEPSIEQVRLEDLGRCSGGSTLYIPPRQRRSPSGDVLQQLQHLASQA